MAQEELRFKASLANFKVSKENQRLFLNNVEIIGTQNLQLALNNPRSSLSHLGMSHLNSAPYGQANGGITIQTLLVNQDYLIPFTGESPVTGYLLSSQDVPKSRIHLTFQPSYLTSYSLRYSDGTIPTVEAAFQCYGNVGQMTTEQITALAQNTAITQSSPDYDLLIPNRGSISASFNEFTTNRVLGFDLSLGVNREASYAIGKIQPYAVRTIPPISVAASFQIEIGDYQVRTLNDTLISPLKQDLSLSVKGFRTQEEISSYNFGNLELIEQNYSSTTNGNVSVSLSYRGAINF